MPTNLTAGQTFYIGYWMLWGGVFLTLTSFIVGAPDPVFFVSVAIQTLGIVIVCGVLFGKTP